MLPEKLFEDGLYELSAATSTKCSAEAQALFREQCGKFARIEEDGPWWNVWIKVQDETETYKQSQ